VFLLPTSHLDGGQKKHFAHPTKELLKYKHFTKITQITKITVQKLINQFEL